MNRQLRILVVDDVPRWRQVVARTLSEAGYRVDAVESITEAADKLKMNIYHLAVLDIRMEEQDMENLEGMSLLQIMDQNGLLGGVVKVIMLSAYGTKELMRAAFARYKVEDFIDKNTFDPEELLRRIEEVNRQEVKINPQLDIKWPAHLSAQQLVLNMEIEGARIKNRTPQQEELAEELDDLLCRLFYNTDSLLLKPLNQGHSGSSVVLATPFFAAGAGHPVVVKFGSYRNIDREYQNYKSHVQPFISGGRSTSVQELRRSLRLGGIVYSLLGSTDDRVEDFSSFYAGAEAGRIRNVLHHLIHETCKNWYANPGVMRLINLSGEYQQRLNLSGARVEKHLAEGLKSVQGKRHLYFNDLQEKRAFTNPIPFAFDSEFSFPTYICTTHGDLNAENILIDKGGQAWLIDFGMTGPGHILRDIAELDTAIRYQLLRPGDATLEERLLMEEALNTPARFTQVAELDDGLASENQNLLKAYEVVVYLRQLAQQLVSHNPSDDINEYYVALLYYSLNTLRFYAWEPLQRMHALLSASLLTDKIRN